MGESENSKKEYKKGMITGLALSVLFILIFLWGWNYKVHSWISDYNIFGTSDKKESDIKLDSDEFRKKVNKLKIFIQSAYLEDVNEDELVNGALKGIVASLGDKYSAYYTAEEYESLLESTEGEYNGIGVMVTKTEEGGGIIVKKVYDDTPAKEAGILENDVILSIDDKDVTQVDLNTAVGYIQESDGEEVSMKVCRDESEIHLQVRLKTIERPTVSSKMLENATGYIKLEEFDGVSTQQFSSAINDLKDLQMKKLIIDIRDNPGGRLDVVCDILDLFVEKDKLLVYTEDKNGKCEEEYSKYGASVTDIPICILVNGNSASASEVFSGVMKDYGLAEIVGSQTFGKGIVQKIFDLGDGSAIKLTVSKYYLPNGENIHEKGIIPDYVVDMAENEKDDAQLEKALEILGE